MRAPVLLWIQLNTLLFLALAAACGGASQPTLRVKAMPKGGSFTGVWFSPQYGEMHIRQSGATAIGRYAKDERVGRIQGNIEGDVMRFEWTERRELIVGRPVQTRGHGYFRIVEDEAEGTWKLIGEWGNDAAERGGGPWNAVKSKTRRPEIDSAGSQSPTGGEDANQDDVEGRDVTEEESKRGEDLSDL